LIEYCKQRSIPASGLPKPKLIKRILHFIDTGEIQDTKKPASAGATIKKAGSSNIAASSKNKLHSKADPADGDSTVDVLS